MTQRRKEPERTYGAKFTKINLSEHANWPPTRLRGAWWRQLAARLKDYPQGPQAPWGIPFVMPAGRAVLAAADRAPAAIPIRGRADYLCLLHEWAQQPEDVHHDRPQEGLPVAEYELAYADGASHVQPVRARYEVTMIESPGPPWVAMPYLMPSVLEILDGAGGQFWGWSQTGTDGSFGVPLVYALPNPRPGAALRSLTVRGLLGSPLLVTGLTLYTGKSHPLRHLPRRHYRVVSSGGAPEVRKAELDLGRVVRTERTAGPRGKKWLASPHAGLAGSADPVAGAEDLIEAAGAEDATLSVQLAGRRGRRKFSLGEAFHRGSTTAAGGGAKLQVVGRDRQWMQVVIRDAQTGQPTPARVHFCGPRGEYLAPYGHHAVVNPGWFMDYGADVVVGGRNYAYVPGEFTTDLPVGDVYVELCKGFEYAPVRRKVTIRPGQKTLDLDVQRTADWRRHGWVTADTHVHFISPHTAALQAQGEGVNVVNLLASQWGRLFTNVGDIRGRVNVLEDDTIVYVGTENRNHMLGHMSMLGTQGQPVYPMCCGGPSEAWIGDPDFRSLAQWARENRAKGGVVIRPHFPQCGHTEDPVPILAGLVDALELHGLHGEDFPTQEWYRYLNCGYRVAVAGGTDKMSAATALGWQRTYARLDPNRPFDYDNWAAAVRAGRTFASTGPLIDMTVEGKCVGAAIALPAHGGAVEVEARAESVWPLGRIEIVRNGRVVAAESAPRGGSAALAVAAEVPVTSSGWIAARCTGSPGHPGHYLAAHTSPVYLTCGRSRAFDAPAAQHMLNLVDGGIEYLNTLATAFDEPSRKRMVALFRQAQQELKGRLLVEGAHNHDHPHDDHRHG